MSAENFKLREINAYYHVDSNDTARTNQTVESVEQEQKMTFHEEDDEYINSNYALAGILAEIRELEDTIKNDDNCNTYKLSEAIKIKRQKLAIIAEALPYLDPLMAERVNDMYKKQVDHTQNYVHSITRAKYRLVEHCFSLVATTVVILGGMLFLSSVLGRPTCTIYQPAPTTTNK